ncbi:MAG: bifunctional proline dehydrogenase/L-glutamate gamma-semialdehyde dehydrogenase PutA [Coxiellaceae bacterium]|nr:bifunctional proline dehydrogenase/L-glutamate gamma-semialdehyde dehydrogenase PutA [Coxiellaceae bacterium]
MFFNEPLAPQAPLLAAMTAAYRQDETACVNRLLAQLDFTPLEHEQIQRLAHDFVTRVREQESDKGGVEALMQHYDLSTEEGIVLMCIAEALLRIPDKKTQDLLIQDKMTSANWDSHIGKSSSTFVNVATWGLALTGNILEITDKAGFFKKVWKGMLRESGEGMIRQAVKEAVKVMSEHFVLGRSIEEAVKRSQELSKRGYRFSFDMLGEVARTMADADRYFAAYQSAIEVLSHADVDHDATSGQSISVKLSALYPRYEFLQKESAIPFLTQRLKTLCQQAKAGGLNLTVDAEETDRLEMSLQIIENVFSDPDLRDWEGLGLALQAYQKRAYFAIQFLIDMAKRYGKRLKVRLVKGAYWDSEIKLTQVGGFNDYPLFTRKTSTDVSYLACAKLMLSAQGIIYPQFATHNAHTVATILTMVEGSGAKFEFQKLQGMGTSLHDQLIGRGIPCRVYAPVGSHEDLLPYLVRRLLENGANSSFVNRIADHTVPIEDIIADPILYTKKLKRIYNPHIPLPKDIYGKARLNSAGIDFSHHQQLIDLTASMMKVDKKRGWVAAPFCGSASKSDKPVFNPADNRDIVGYCAVATKEDVERGLQNAVKAFPAWDELGVDARADLLLKAADLLEAHGAELMMLVMREAGKVLADALAELREAVDFCRYYAMQARELMAEKVMPGPTGESNVLRMHGRGPMLCISPWNFPMAIFTGQMAAALVTGNTVITKPAETTPLIAQRIVELFYEAGVPKGALQLMPGPGSVVGQLLVEDDRIAGVIFTGSTGTAKRIQQGLAGREGPIVPFIAETGGINAMIVDSSALPEQVVRDVVQSAFGSAGQRCSALRLLCIQEDVADGVIKMLKGAMEMLQVGDPTLLATDVGPVIDKPSKERLDQHGNELEKTAKLIVKVTLDNEAQHGTFVEPQAYELNSVDDLKEEFFGPMLHVVRYKSSQLDQLIDAINAKGFGLTFGIQSRIDYSVQKIQRRIKAGNIYVNRNMIGAVVGVQPFGGSWLSGTGPKAGGPHYLARLCNESTLTIDTTAAGGNASLMVLQEED